MEKIFTLTDCLGDTCYYSLIKMKKTEQTSLSHLVALQKILLETVLKHMENREENRDL